MIIDLFRLETEGFFESLSEYLEQLEAQIPAIGKAEFERLKPGAQQDYEQGLAEYEMEVDSLRWNYEYFFPRSLRYSFVVLLFLVVEKQLTEFCSRIQERRGLSLKVGDMKGDLIERSRKYIHKYGGVPTVPDWRNVENLAIVRNCIVHTMGQIDDSRDRQQLKNLASSLLGLAIGHSEFETVDTLQLSAEYCSQAVRDMRSFFGQLFDAEASLRESSST